MATKIAKLKYLTDAQCVQFNDYGSITWHVFKNEADAIRWKLKLVEWNGNLRGVNSTMFFNARGVAVIYAEGPYAYVKLCGAKGLSRTWSECKDLEDAETRVLRRINELRECKDFCGEDEYD